MESERASPAAGRRRRAVLAGHQGDADAAREFLRDPDPAVRASALGALVRLDAVAPADVEAALIDPDAPVRRRACEVAAAVEVDLASMLQDPDASVVEAAAWALGERGHGDAERLISVATTHTDPLCREAAVAALGAIGDVAGLPAVLAAAANDRPAVRRRAVIALANFDGPDADAALRAALEDRDWQVRQAAEDLLDES